MLAVEPTMDGDFPPHELPPPGGGIQLQNRLLHCPWWSSFSPASYPTFSGENQQFLGSTPFLDGQSCPDTSYPTTATVPSFFSKSSDFPQPAPDLNQLLLQEKAPVNPYSAFHLQVAWSPYPMGSDIPAR